MKNQKTLTIISACSTMLCSNFQLLAENVNRKLATAITLLVILCSFNTSNAQNCTVNQPNSQIVCNNSSTAAVNFTGSVPGSVFNWTNNNPSIGLAASGTGDIASFIATNNSSVPVVATVTVTASATGGAGFAYIPNVGSNNVSVINTVTNTVVATVSVGSGPYGVSVSPDGSKVYVANIGSNNVSVINTATNTVVATVGVGASPRGVSVSPDDSKVYVTNFVSNNVSVINTATNAVLATVPVGTNPIGVSVSPDGSKVYVSNINSNNVSVINTVTNTVVATVGVGSSPLGISVSPDGSKVYVANNASNNVSVINMATNTVVATVSVGSGPYGVSVSPDGSKVYVTNQNSSSVSVIDTANNSVVAAVGVGDGPQGVSVSPDGSKVYVANYSSNNVSVINTVNNTVVATVGGLSLPRALGNFITGSTACTSTPKTFTITVNPNAAPSISGTLSICQGSSTTLNAGVFTNYNWSTGATTQTISVNTIGTFTVTVTNANGCTGTASVTTSAFVAPVITGNLTPCIGSSTTLSTGVYNSYLWSTGATTQSVTVTANAVYKVTVTNAGGCTGSASAKVVKKARPTFTLNTVDTNLCPPVTSVVLSLIGNAASYSWSPATGLNQTTGTSVIATPLVTTSYYLTATGSNGCTLSSYANVNIKPKPLLLTTTAITANSATLNWKIVDCATGYTVQYRLAGGTWLSVPVSTNIGIKVLNGLLASSSYQWRIKAKYPNGTTSKYTNPVSFTTPALRLGETVTVNALQVYPNPATDKLNLEFPFTEGDATITVVNALGQIVLTQNVKDTEGELELNIQSLTEGLYFVTVKNGDNTFNSRFVKR